MATLPKSLVHWMAGVLLGLATCVATGSAQQSPQPGFPGGGLWKAPPNRMVPIEIADGLVIVTGAISSRGGSSGPMPFVVDTAATATVIDNAKAQRLGWKAPPKALYPGRTLDIAGASIQNAPVFGLPLAGLARQAGVPVDAVVGSDIFQHFAVRLNYIDHWIMLEVPESCAIPEKKVHLRMVGGLPFVEASVAAPGGQAVQGLFLVDSGQPGAGLILTSAFAAKHPEFKAKTAKLPAFDAAGTVQQTDFLRVGTLQLGENAMHDVVATVASPSAGDSQLAGVIGAGVLSRFDLLVDLPRHSLALTPNARFSDPFEADMSGVLLLSGDADGRSGQAATHPGGHVYMVAGIAEKSPASEAGLQAGDRLVAIADRDTRDMTMEMIRGILKSRPGTKVMVGVDRSGKKLQVVLTLRRAI